MNIDNPGRRIRAPWEARSNVAVRRNDGGDTLDSRRVPVIGILPLEAKNHFVAMMSEFAGTFMFLLFAFGGTNAVTTAPDTGEPLNANPAKLLYISLCFGMSLAVNAVGTMSQCSLMFLC
jgi:aquaporin rerated protein, other eukaryote